MTPCTWPSAWLIATGTLSATTRATPGAATSKSGGYNSPPDGFLSHQAILSAAFEIAREAGPRSPTPTSAVVLLERALEEQLGLPPGAWSALCGAVLAEPAPRATRPAVARAADTILASAPGILASVAGVPGLEETEVCSTACSNVCSLCGASLLFRP